MSKSSRAFLAKQEEDFTKGELINKKDVALHIDVYCYSCKRLVALSNTTEIDGRRYCPKCSGGI